MSGELLHATAVAINGEGVLLQGPSGSGKSDLALRLIDRGATLISDDGVLIETGDVFPMLRTAPHIAGMIEMRGVGVLKMPFVDGVPLRLSVQLDEPAERLPNNLSIKIAGHDIASLQLSAFETSAPLKVEYALLTASESRKA